jgi:bifunctional oligoribonuclease and PAP phosphatase NrnA
MSESLRQIIDTLAKTRRVLITTHVRPDGDALGSAAALQLALREKHIAAPVLLLSKLPTKYSFLFHDNDVEHVTLEGDAPATLLDGFDALLVVDTGTWSQLPGLKAVVSTWDKPRLVVDHHQTQEAWASVLWQDVTASAAGEMVETLLDRWDVPISKPIAECLFVAIASDTGWFQFSNTTPRTLRLVAQLMEHGVDTDAIYQRLYQNERPERLLLQQRAVASMRFDADFQIASMVIRSDDFIQTLANVPDTENLVNIPLQVASVKASLVFTEPPEGGPIRVSFRSKGAIDVARFAEQFGGGGHARASGAKVDGALDSVRERVVAALMNHMRDAPTPPP